VQTFSKSERLNSKKVIDELFEKGKSFNQFPLKIIWRLLPDEYTHTQVLFSVPKRIYKRAVDRNRIKRLMREAYRKNKKELIDAVGLKKIAIMMIYLDKQIMDYHQLEKEIILGLKRLIKENI